MNITFLERIILGKWGTTFLSRCELIQESKFTIRQRKHIVIVLWPHLINIPSNKRVIWSPQRAMFCQIRFCGSVRFQASKMGSLPANRCKSRDSCGISSGPNTKIYNPYGINALNKCYIFLKNTYSRVNIKTPPLGLTMNDFF